MIITYDNILQTESQSHWWYKLKRFIHDWQWCLMIWNRLTMMTQFEKSMLLLTSKQNVIALNRIVWLSNWFIAEILLLQLWIKLSTINSVRYDMHHNNFSFIFSSMKHSICKRVTVSLEYALSWFYEVQLWLFSYSFTEAWEDYYKDLRQEWLSLQQL